MAIVTSRFFILLLLLAALSASCAAQSRSAYGELGMFNGGMLTTRYDADVGVTYEVTVKALDDLGVNVLNASKEETQAVIQAQRPKDRAPVLINLSWQRHDKTVAVIKVGDAGDESYSRAIAVAIDTRLKQREVRTTDEKEVQPGRPATRY